MDFDHAVTDLRGGREGRPPPHRGLQILAICHNRMFGDPPSS